MKKIIIIFLIIGAGIIAWLFLFKEKGDSNLDNSYFNLLVTDEEKEKKSEVEAVSVLASGLNTPWQIVLLQNGDILLSERGGRVRLYKKDLGLKDEPVLEMPQVYEIGEGGLLGLTLHPEFASNNYVYAFYTYRAKDGNPRNRVSRFIYQEGKLINEEIILDNLPANLYHNGGRIKFGPDSYLYITLGDAQNPGSAQDLDYLGGKILRVTDKGEAAIDNPAANLIYSFGHRNPQGLAWDKAGQLYASEHGRSGAASGLDEFNKIIAGGNYGWPDIEGDLEGEGMISPSLHSGENNTWAPSGLASHEDVFFMAGLRGEALYKIEKEEDSYKITEYFHKEFGRLRDVVLGEDNYLYLITNNRDGRGNPQEGDDKLIKIDITSLPKTKQGE